MTLKMYTLRNSLLYFVDFQLNLTVLSEQFETDGVVVTLEWIQHDFYSYNVSVVPSLEYDIEETTRVQLNMSYNTFYDVNIIASPPCELNSTTDFIELHYCEYVLLKLCYTIMFHVMIIDMSLKPA